MARTAVVIMMLAATLATGGTSSATSGSVTAGVSGGSGGSGDGCEISAPNADFSQQVAASTGHARVWRLYQAFFLRQPDEDGFDYWLQTRNGGATLGDIAYQFAQGPEFINSYGELSHAEFVDLAYANVLCREPDDEGRAYWAGLLTSGSLTRWDMIINFVELGEYLEFTSTCHSIYPEQSASVDDCAESKIVPLAAANMTDHGYRAIETDIPGGSFSGVEVDMTRDLFETGTSRCSVASINANWLVASEKDRANPGVLGIGVVDGVHVKGSSDRTDRGIFGLRFDASPSDVVEVWPGDSLSDDDTRLNSVMYKSGRKALESWHASAESSPYLEVLAPEEIVTNSEWVWAAAGVPLIIDGQTDQDFSSDYHNDPYTYQTVRHPFVAFDQDSKRLIFGATANADVADLVNWASSNGYEDLIKFDGGASAEYNIAGQAVVAGTSRDIPVWLGIGC
ncbi:MAG: DUF4214 domain-containing protein [Acidimicrobiales bacterium]